MKESNQNYIIAILLGILTNTSHTSLAIILGTIASLIFITLALLQNLSGE